MQKITDNIFLLVIFAMIGTLILATSFVIFFLRYQRKAQQQREALQQAELTYSENLLHAALQSQEEERKRIGRDLHDDVGASLANLRMVLSRQTAPEGATAPPYKPLIDHIISTVRNISHSLSPPGLDLFGLEHTLHELCDTFNTAGQLQLRFTNEAGDRVDALPKEVALALYRVVQELLSNTIKHAEAQKVDLIFSQNGNQLTLRYTDDGKGMDPDRAKRAGMGMQNIAGRLRMIQATYEVVTSPGNGFSMTILLP